MRAYELMVIIDPEVEERTVEPSLDKFLNVIRNDGGTIDKVDIWGRRRLAYEIQKKSEDNAAVVGGVFFRAGNDRLDIYSKCFSFGQRGLDSLVHDERSGHVGEHSNAMCVGS